MYLPDSVWGATPEWSVDDFTTNFGITLSFFNQVSNEYSIITTSILVYDNHV